MTLSTNHTENAAKAVPPVPRPSQPAHIVRTDAEAIAVAKTLAAEFIKYSALRVRDRIWPVKELDAFSQSGLWSINVPKAFGGP
jgi:alkylation response protein AidB-like acyl-CoA dehydrogenase